MSQLKTLPRRNIYEINDMVQRLSPGALLMFHKQVYGNYWLSLAHDQLCERCFTQETIFLFVKQEYSGGPLTVLVDEQLFIGRPGLFTPVGDEIPKRFRT